jgi:hypothetical protein
LDDAPVVKKKGAHMKPLTTEQKQELVEIIKGEYGNALDFDDFTNALLGLLEDVPGFETAKESTINKLTQLVLPRFLGYSVKSGLMDITIT